MLIDPLGHLYSNLKFAPHICPGLSPSSFPIWIPEFRPSVLGLALKPPTPTPLTRGPVEPVVATQRLFLNFEFCFTSRKSSPSCPCLPADCSPASSAGCSGFFRIWLQPTSGLFSHRSLAHVLDSSRRPCHVRSVASLSNKGSPWTGCGEPAARRSAPFHLPGASSCLLSVRAALPRSKGFLSCSSLLGLADPVCHFQFWNWTEMLIHDIYSYRVDHLVSCHLTHWEFLFLFFLKH